VAVVSPGTTSLTAVNTRNDQLRQAAALYATLIETDEAATAVSTAIGYELTHPISSSLDDRAAVISITVTASTPAQAVSGAEEAFSWLVGKLGEPLLTADTSGSAENATDSPITLSGPFDSSTVIGFDESLGSVNSSLFLQIANDLDLPTTLSIASSAGETIITRSTLSPTMSLLFTLQDSNDVVQDTLRIAPPQLPSVVEMAPVLTVSLNEGSIAGIGSGDDRTWSLLASRIDLAWTERSPASDSNVQPDAAIDVEIATLTSELGVIPVGGRRGPITAVAALLVGSLALLSLVIVADGWNRARDDALADSATAAAALDSEPTADEKGAPKASTSGESHEGEAPTSQAHPPARPWEQDRDMANKR
jgi:hypothetical protein